MWRGLGPLLTRFFFIYFFSFVQGGEPDKIVDEAEKIERTYLNLLNKLSASLNGNQRKVRVVIGVIGIAVVVVVLTTASCVTQHSFLRGGGALDHSSCLTQEVFGTGHLLIRDSLLDSTPHQGGVYFKNTYFPWRAL